MIFWWSLYVLGLYLSRSVGSTLFTDLLNIGKCCTELNFNVPVSNMLVMLRHCIHGTFTQAKTNNEIKALPY